MQKVQCMLHPCMIDTNAVACFARGTDREWSIANRLLLPHRTIEKRKIVHSIKAGSAIPTTERFRMRPRHHVIATRWNFCVHYKIEMWDFFSTTPRPRPAPCSREIPKTVSGGLFAMRPSIPICPAPFARHVANATGLSSTTIGVRLRNSRARSPRQ